MCVRVHVSQYSTFLTIYRTCPSSALSIFQQCDFCKNLLQTFLHSRPGRRYTPAVNSHSCEKKQREHTLSGIYIYTHQIHPYMHAYYSLSLFTDKGGQGTKAHDQKKKPGSFSFIGELNRLSLLQSHAYQTLLFLSIFTILLFVTFVAGCQQ